MKKLFTIIAVASMMLTTVFGFTSCQKDELPAPAPQTVTTNNNGNNGQSVTVTSVNSQYDNNGGTIINTDTKETSASTTDPFANMSGTWEYIDAEGTKCTLVLSNEGKSTLPQKVGSNNEYVSAAKYDAELTIGDKKYTGKFMTGRFGTQTDAGAYVILASNYASSASANSFSADIKVSGNLTAQGITLTKVK